MNRATIAFTAEGSELVCTSTREQYMRTQAEVVEPVQFVRHTPSTGSRDFE